MFTVRVRVQFHFESSLCYGWHMDPDDELFRVIIDNIESLQNELNTISLERYNLMIPAIKENFEIAKKYIISEDWIYNNTKLLK